MQGPVQLNHACSELGQHTKGFPEAGLPHYLQGTDVGSSGTISVPALNGCIHLHYPLASLHPRDLAF